MLIYRHGLIDALKKSLRKEYDIQLEEKSIKNLIHVLTNKFTSSSNQKTYSCCVFLQKEHMEKDYGVSNSFSNMLNNPEFYKILKELVQFGITRYQMFYSKHYQDTNFVLYQKYTYEDACRLLEWEKNEVPLNIGGYKYDKITKTFPVFINYDKAEDIQDTIKYEDYFINENTLIAISKQGRMIGSEDVRNFLHSEQRGIKIELFVRKNKDDKISKEFYYLGRMKATGKAEEKFGLFGLSIKNGQILKCYELMNSSNGLFVYVTLPRKYRKPFYYYLFQNSRTSKKCPICHSEWKLTGKQ